MKSSRGKSGLTRACRVFGLAVLFLVSGVVIENTAIAKDGDSLSNTIAAKTEKAASTDDANMISAPATGSPIKLVLQITIDQLRGDLPRIFKQRFGPNGFRYLMDKGVFYVNAHYTHADTETGPGHATLVTGGQPAQHGIIGGDWWDEPKKRIMYSVEDNDFPVHSDHMDTDLGKTTGGRAPTNLESTTIADEMFMASEEKAKIFAVSGKDRSSIIPAGRTGKAFWLEHGNFVTSTYYYKQPPDWLVAWNGRKLADSYRDKTWDLLQNRSTYWRANKDDIPYEGTYKHLGRTMPKKLGTDDVEAYYKGLEHTIVNDEMVLAFAKDLIDREKLGQGKTADYLSVSFSSTDMIGHTWGVNSLEAEDNMLRVDKNLADLFSFVDKEVGLNKTLIVLSADHGVADVTEYIQSLGFPAKRVDPQALPKQVNEALKKKYSSDADILQPFVYPYFYLNLETIDRLKLKVEDVERATAEESMKFPGIYFAATRSDILAGRLLSGNPHMQRVSNTFHPKRSGHVHLIAEQNAVLMHYPWNLKTGLHGTVWTYDTYVPIMFAAPGVTPRECSRPVGPQDIAPTISTFLGIKPPSGSVGTPLSEVVENRTTDRK